MVILHILKSTTTKTHAGGSGCIFYAIFHGGTMSVMRIVQVQLICFLLLVPDGDAHPGLPIGVLQRVRTLGVDILHNYVPITVVGLKNPHKSVVRDGGFTPQLVPDLYSPSHGRGMLIFLNDILILIIIIIRQYNDLHFFGFFFFGLFLEWLRRRCRCRCWRVNFLLLGFLLLMWLHGLIQATRRVVASGADASGLISTRYL